MVVLGDLNDFAFSRPLLTLTTGGKLLDDLIERLPAQRALLVRLRGQLAGARPHPDEPAPPRARSPAIDAVHVNAEFADQASDHDPLVARARVR